MAPSAFVPPCIVLVALGSLALTSAGCFEPAKASGRTSELEITAPAPAFRPLGSSSCLAAYAPQGRTCVHESYRASVSEAELVLQVQAYERGSASPMLGTRESPSSELPRTRAQIRRLSPGALAGSSAPRDAQASKRARLAALERMLAALAGRSATSPEKAPGSSGTGASAEPNTAAVGEVSRTTVFGQMHELLQGVAPQEALETMKQLETAGARRLVTEEQWRELMKGTYTDAPGLAGK